MAKGHTHCRIPGRTKYILGIRPDYNGLCISPIIPKSWSGFEATRLYRNVKYLISVVRVGTGNNSIIYVNDEKIEGNIIPLPPPGTKQIFIKVEIS